jgi:hypothetical protein
MAVMTLVMLAMLRCSVALRSYSDRFFDTLNINTDSVGKFAVLTLPHTGVAARVKASKKYFMTILIDKKLLWLGHGNKTLHNFRYWFL